MDRNSQGNTVDIVNDPIFKEVNDVFTGVKAYLKKQGKGSVKQKPIIEPDDIKMLYESDVLVVTNPRTLQNKVFFELLFYLCRRGQQNLPMLTPEHFQVVTEDGRRYLVQVKDELLKNHREDDDQESSVDAGRLPEIPGNFFSFVNLCVIERPRATLFF